MRTNKTETYGYKYPYQKRDSNPRVLVPRDSTSETQNQEKISPPEDYQNCDDNLRSPARKMLIILTLISNPLEKAANREIYKEKLL